MAGRQLLDTKHSRPPLTRPILFDTLAHGFLDLQRHRAVVCALEEGDGQVLPCCVRGLGAEDAEGLGLEERHKVGGCRRVDVVIESVDGVGRGKGQVVVLGVKVSIGIPIQGWSERKR